VSVAVDVTAGRSSLLRLLGGLSLAGSGALALGRVTGGKRVAALDDGGARDQPR
jgi:hypothetical protein